MRPALFLLVSGALFAAVPASHAQLYKWVDDSGVINYGDWPPAGVKLQPVNHGTFSSVADSALVGTAARPTGAPRNTARAASPTAAVPSQAPSSSAQAAPDNASVDSTYAPYYGYAPRPVAVEAAAERRREVVPVVKPILPIDPALPDMPLRPRR
jgi:hypothetical protein